MWTIIKTFLLTEKLWFILAACLLEISLCTSCYLYGRHAEKISYYKATEGAQVEQQKEDDKQTQTAIKNEAERASNDTQLELSKEQVKNKINELSKDDPCNSNKLNDDELLYLNGLIDKANAKKPPVLNH